MEEPRTAFDGSRTLRGYIRSCVVGVLRVFSVSVRVVQVLWVLWVAGRSEVRGAMGRRLLPLMVDRGGLGRHLEVISMRMRVRKVVHPDLGRLRAG